MKYRKNNKAFTLIEVLVALLIVAVAMAAIIKATADGTRTFTKLADYTIAHWVGTDIITSIQLGEIDTPTSDNPTTGNTKFKFFNKSWYFTASTSDTDNKKIKKLVVEVKPTEDGQTVIKEYGFIEKK